MRNSLLKTNPYLKNDEEQKRIIANLTIASFAIEGKKKGAKKAIRNIYGKF